MQALVPTGSDTMFSYGHHTITVPLPQSMLVLREVSHTPLETLACSSLLPPTIFPFPQPFPSLHYRHHHNCDLDPFYLEHRSTGSEGESVETSLCQVPVNIILQNCQHLVR